MKPKIERLCLNSLDFVHFVYKILGTAGVAKNREETKKCVFPLRADVFFY